jgi:hypothetical protein
LGQIDLQIISAMMKMPEFHKDLAQLFVSERSTSGSKAEELGVVKEQTER